MLFQNLISLSTLILIEFCLCNTCPKGWYYMNLNCYKLFDESLSFSEAKKHCSTFNATLLIIKSEKENHLIKNLIFDEWRQVINFWIDARKIIGGDIDDWVWSDYYKVKYLNWAPEQPNQNGLQNCLELCREYTGKYNWSAGAWNDISCEEKKSVICQKLQISNDNKEILENVDNSKLSTVLLSLLPFIALICIIAGKILFKRSDMKFIKPPEPIFGCLLLKDPSEQCLARLMGRQCNTPEEVEFHI